MYNAFPFLGFIFWAGFFTWLGVAAWARYLREVERQKTLRAFAERGAPLDKEMMEKLFPTAAWRQQAAESWQVTQRNTTQGLAIGGIVTLFAGVGLLIGAQFVGRIERDALFGMSTGGVIACCVGLGLLVASWLTRRMLAADRDRTAVGGDEPR